MIIYYECAWHLRVIKFVVVRDSFSVGLVTRYVLSTLLSLLCCMLACLPHPTHAHTRICMRVRNPLRAIPVCLGGHFSSVYESEEGYYCPFYVEIPWRERVSLAAPRAHPHTPPPSHPSRYPILPSGGRDTHSLLYVVWCVDHCYTGSAAESLIYTNRSLSFSTCLPTLTRHCLRRRCCRRRCCCCCRSPRSFSFIHESVSSSFFTVASGTITVSRHCLSFFLSRLLARSLVLSIYLSICVCVCVCSPALG